MKSWRPRRILLLAAGVTLIVFSLSLVVYAFAPAIQQRLGLTPKVSVRARHRNAVIIPAIGVSVRLVNGRRGTAALRRGVWRHPNAGRPGGPGTTVIAGHRTSRQFYLLYNLKRGSRIYVWYGGRRYRYRVVAKRTVPPGRFRVVHYGRRQKLMLYTCLPRWQGNRRQVVYANRI